MWLFVMFDLPTDDKPARKRYTQFRNLLLKQGFLMMQYSVYARYFNCEAKAKPHQQRIRKGLPPEGNVRLLLVTDRQFGKMEVYKGKKRRDTEAPPDQLLLF